MRVPGVPTSLLFGLCTPFFKAAVPTHNFKASTGSKFFSLAALATSLPLKNSTGSGLLPLAVFPPMPTKLPNLSQKLPSIMETCGPFISVSFSPLRVLSLADLGNTPCTPSAMTSPIIGPSKGLPPINSVKTLSAALAALTNNLPPLIMAPVTGCSLKTCGHGR
ncbi:MAG: hypothetical protein ACD_73C00047G0001 [uncultured bacterium]|nr:MAG: hypothetical protein ACD_73C00047G0001 [uncultured bacterium]